jgi:hypothetical protein
VSLVSPIGDATGGSGNLATSLSNVARVAAHSKCLWVFNANYDGTIIYNDPVPRARNIFVLKLCSNYSSAFCGVRLQAYSLKSLAG